MPEQIPTEKKPQQNNPKSQPGVSPGNKPVQPDLDKEKPRTATQSEHTSQRFGDDVDKSKYLNDQDLEDTEEPGDEASP